jgi:hypothetical protein
MEYVSIQNSSIGRNNDLGFFVTSTTFTISCHSHWRNQRVARVGGARGWQGWAELEGGKGGRSQRVARIDGATLTQNPGSVTSLGYEYKL